MIFAYLYWITAVSGEISCIFTSAKEIVFFSGFSVFVY